MTLLGNCAIGVIFRGASGVLALMVRLAICVAMESNATSTGLRRLSKESIRRRTDLLIIGPIIRAKCTASTYFARFFCGNFRDLVRFRRYFDLSACGLRGLRFYQVQGCRERCSYPGKYHRVASSIVGHRVWREITKTGFEGVL